MAGSASVPVKVIKEIKSRLGAAAVLEGVEDRYVYSFDATGTIVMPAFVVVPADAEDLAWTCETLWSAGVPLVPRGAGTGYAGGAVPPPGGVVVVCDRVNEINGPADGVVEVGPGVVCDDLNRYLSRFGVFYPVDPASTESSTLGGHVASNAGGPRALKYGVTRDYVRAVEVVSPGRGREVINDRPGRTDLLSLVVGSEGTLAVILRMWLRVLPAPATVAAAVATFRDARAAGEAANAVLDGGVLPSKLEFLDSRCVECVNAKEAGTFDAAAGAVLLFEFDGTEPAVAHELERAAALVRGAGTLDVRVADDREEAEGLWRLRRGVSPALGMLAPHKTNEDVCVPRSRVPELLDYIRGLERDYDVPVPTFGHIGDGNLHVNFMYDRRAGDVSRRVADAVEKLMNRVVDLGGTITGEHGVGLAKAAFLPREQSPAEFALAARVKSAFDPAGLLNPGKIFGK
ncbi:MAG: FAD-linked oxidase C-terminal domain-containing protein [Candidatus Zixiibacteriota bacterium]|jgi:glycolate oxidase